MLRLERAGFAMQIKGIGSSLVRQPDNSLFFVQWLFLGNLRSAIIVSATIPFALFFAVTILVLRGEKPWARAIPTGA